MALQTRQWQTVLVSVVVHVVAMFLIIVVPLLAFDGFPALRSATEYVPVELKMPEMPPAPPPAVATSTPVAPVSSIPLSAPKEVGPERPPALPSISILQGTPGSTNFLGATAAVQTGDVAPPAAPKADAPIRPGGVVRPPDRLVGVRPEYPPMAIAARVSGSVIIEAIIGTDGLVRDAKILRSIPLLDEAALRAVRQWRYSPTLLNGVPVAVIMTVTVTFTLDRLAF